MKTILIAASFLLPVFGFAQLVDTAAFYLQVDSLVGVSRDFANERQFDQALEILEQAEKMVLETLGKESAAYGTTCFHHGRALHIKGDYAEAERWYLESKGIRGRILGVVDPEYSKCLNNLAILYRSMGNYEAAEPLYRETIAIRAHALGKKDPAYASALRNYAIMLTDLSRYEEAEPLLLETQAIYLEVYGPEDADYAQSLNTLATAYMETGDYESAEPLYLEAISIQKKTLGEEDSNYGVSLFNLGNLYLVMGNYSEAEPLYLQAQKIWENKLGKNDPLYLLCINNLATLYLYTFQYEPSESYYLVALEPFSPEADSTNPDYARSLNNLAILYFRQNRYAKAEPLYHQAIAIYEAAFGKEHPDYAMCINNLAEQYMQAGDFIEAERLYLEANKIWEKAFGKMHPQYLASLSGLADLYSLMQQPDQAAAYFTEAAALQRSLLTNAIHHLSELELNRYQLIFKKSQSKLLAFAAQMKSPAMAGFCYEEALFYKGFLLNSSNQINKLARSNSTAIEKFNRLKALERRRAAEYSKVLADRTNVEALETQSNQLEKELARTVAGYGAAIRQVHWQDVQSTLKSGQAALEFVRYGVSNNKQTAPIQYAALLIRPGNTQVQFIPLFEEQQLDSLLQTNGARRADYVNRLYSLPDRGVTPVGQPQKSLYELLWQPLETALAGVSTVYFSPTGLLHRLNLGAIPLQDETALADRYQLIELGSTRQLVVGGSPEASRTASPDRQAHLFGGILYEPDSIAIEPDNTGFHTEALASRGTMRFIRTDSSLRGGNWNYLKWTEKEVSALEPILETGGIPTTVFKGYAATEEVFKSMGAQGKPSPRVVHLATHGYFFPDLGKVADAAEPVFKISEQPMIRSGLILAGGNYTWQTGQLLRPDREDGVLTAYEISQMNLSNTELVVLSACETGLGDIQGNEGVYGLQRAFKIAGAKYLIMSLWQVPDFQTQELMVSFYSKWLGEKMAIPEAFRSAQKEMREKYYDPYFWAGFVLVE